MQHRYLLGAVLALSIGSAAQAQVPSSQPVSPAPAEGPQTGDQSDVSATVADFRPGMVVKDPSGATIGPVTRVGQTVDGAVAVEVDLDGRPVPLSPDILTINPSGSGAVSSMTKADIRAAAARSGQ